MSLAPIILFTYRRPNHAMQTVEALLRNKEALTSDLIIYSDAPKDKDAEDGVNKTREYIRTITGFKSVQIIERSHNWGLANSIIDGVTSVINKCRKFDFNNSYPYTEMLKAQIRGEVDSWAIRWYASALVNDKLTLYPGRSLVFQNGMDGIGGTHCGEDPRYIVELSPTPIMLKKIKTKESKKARRAMTNYFVSLLSRKARKKRFWTNLFSIS